QSQSISPTVRLALFDVIGQSQITMTQNSSSLAGAAPASSSSESPGCGGGNEAAEPISVHYSPGAARPSGFLVGLDKEDIPIALRPDISWHGRETPRCGTVSRPCHPARPKVSRVSLRFTTQLASAARPRLEHPPTDTTPRKKSANAPVCAPTPCDRDCHAGS